MNQTTFEKGRMEMGASLLEERFGAVSSTTRNRLEEMSMEELRSLAMKIGSASSLAELGLPG